MWSVLSGLQVKAVVPIIQLIQSLAVLTTSLLFTQNYPESVAVTDGQSFDFVIVGGGSAGCVVANRLTEIGNWTVLMIEAGDDPPYVTESPGLSVLLGATLPDWKYYTANDGFSAQAHKQNNVHSIQGKMIGGSSNVNYMYYLRGNEEDYEDWVTKGNNGWDWKTVTEYFKKSENLNDTVLSKGETYYLHGKNGYLGVTRPLWVNETKEYFNAFREQGHSILEDTNGFNQLGYSLPTFTIDSQRRQSTGLAFIKPIMNRRNLFVLKNTKARKIIFDENKRAIAVEVKHNDVIKNIYAKKEIIISAGSINSPQLLMLSGIGPKLHLDEMGIVTLVDTPNVGANLQDHMLLPVILSRQIGSASLLDNLSIFVNIDKFPVPTILGFVALNKSQTFPDYQITAYPLPTGSLLPTLMCSEVFTWNDEICISVADSVKRETLLTLMALLHPTSRGRIKLKSNNPDDKPIINSGYFSSEEDLIKFAKCIKDYTSVTNTEKAKSMKLEVVKLNVQQCENIEFGSQKYWECYALNLVASQFHYSGTCGMGPEGEGVVDERLRVRDVKSLRVVDASIMPSIVSGNTYAPVVMIAEKASDMIKTDNGIKLAEFY